MTDPRKKSLHLPPEVMDEIRAEAHRLDRPISWIVQRAWTLAAERVRGTSPTLAPQDEPSKTAPQQATALTVDASPVAAPARPVERAAPAPAPLARPVPVERPARVLEPLDALGRVRSPDHPREPEEPPELWPFGEPTF